MTDGCTNVKVDIIGRLSEESVSLAVGFAHLQKFHAKVMFSLLKWNIRFYHVSAEFTLFPADTVMSNMVFEELVWLRSG